MCRLYISSCVSVTVYPITEADPPPVTTNVYYDVQINSINNVLNPLAQDYDPSNNPLAIVSMNTSPINGTAAVINNGQAISYTPTSGFYSESSNGVLQPFDEFNCEISNGKGGLASQEVTVYVYSENPPSVTITNNPIQSSYTAGSTISFTAVITNIPPQNIANVNFYLDGNLIDEVSNGINGSYTLNWTNVFIGGGDQETITAAATDILGEQGTSPYDQIDVVGSSGALTASLDSFVDSSGMHNLNTNPEALPPLAYHSRWSVSTVWQGYKHVRQRYMDVECLFRRWFHPASQPNAGLNRPCRHCKYSRPHFEQLRSDDASKRSI